MAVAKFLVQTNKYFLLVHWNQAHMLAPIEFLCLLWQFTLRRKLLQLRNTLFAMLRQIHTSCRSESST